MADVLQNHGVNKQDWAYYNSGQSIHGQRGKKGVDINISPVWLKKGQNQRTIIVAVVDTGVYIEGKNVRDHLWTRFKNDDRDKKTAYEDEHGWDFYNDDSTLYDNYLYDYHGTYIANEILKIDDNIKLMCCKFMKGSKGNSKDAVKAIKYAIDNHAQIINCSWAVLSEDDELKELIAENQDVLFVCAAGNSKLDLDKSNIYPACYNYDNIITVGSINHLGDLYEYGGYGKNNVDIMAPGERIKVVLPEDDIDYVDGTSISAAYVTGIAAILMGSNKNLSATDVHHIINDTARHSKKLEMKCQSGGMLDAYNAYKQSVRKD